MGETVTWILKALEAIITGWLLWKVAQIGKDKALIEKATEEIKLAALSVEINSKIVATQAEQIHEAVNSNHTRMVEALDGKTKEIKALVKEAGIQEGRIIEIEKEAERKNGT